MKSVAWLELRLEGPMAAFGTPMIDAAGPTARFPGRSMLTGILANALGWRRTEPERMDALQQRIVTVAIEGPEETEILTDFQSVDLSMDDSAWTTRGEPAIRKGQAGTYAGAHLRRREYVEDPRVRILLRLDPARGEPTLETIAAALERPARPLFLGRKCCPPTRPLAAGTLTLPADAGAAGRAAATGAEVGGRISWTPGKGDKLKGPGIVTYSICDERRHTTGLHGGSRMIVEARIERAGAAGSAADGEGTC